MLQKYKNKLLDIILGCEQKFNVNTVSLLIQWKEWNWREIL